MTMAREKLSFRSEGGSLPGLEMRGRVLSVMGEAGVTQAPVPTRVSTTRPLTAALCVPSAWCSRNHVKQSALDGQIGFGR